MTLPNRCDDLRRPCLDLLAAFALLMGGCSSFIDQKVEPLPGPSGVNRRLQLWPVSRPTAQTQPAATRPAEPSDPLAGPHRLDPLNIIQLIYHKSPLVASSRREMIAARYGLEEFRANLSRFEPFVRANADAVRSPEQRDSRGVTGEIAGGIEKETFEGAVLRLEGGVSGSRFTFGEVDEDEDEVERGSGTLIRARLEVPFVGSRKRQDRTISSAFQESSARKAVLDYLRYYRNYASNALTYYRSALLSLGYLRAYERKLVKLEALLENPRVKPEDRLRVQSSAGDAKVLRDQYEAQHRSSLLSLLEYLGIKPGEAYVLAEPPDIPSPYLEPSQRPEGRRQMLEEAYENNPRFRVLRDAIKDAELQRSQAILGTYEITAYVEGTQFPFGAETFDDRVGGWQIGAGLSVRLNDQRVLTASRKKAEAGIRRFRAEIEAEQLSVQRQIATQSNKILSYYETRPQILENIDKGTTQFEERSRIYLSGKPSSLTIDDVLTSLSLITSAEVRLASNVYYAARANDALMAASGEVYRLVGMKMEDNGNGMELSEEVLIQRSW